MNSYNKKALLIIFIMFSIVLLNMCGCKESEDSIIKTNSIQYIIQSKDTTQKQIHIELYSSTKQGIKINLIQKYDTIVKDTCFNIILLTQEKYILTSLSERIIDTQDILGIRIRPDNYKYGTSHGNTCKIEEIEINNEFFNLN